MKTKKKNPQDATLRNIRALKKRVRQLEREVVALYAWVMPPMGTGGVKK